MKKLIFLLLPVTSLIGSGSLNAQVIYSNDDVEVTQLDDNLYKLRETIFFTANLLALTGKDGILLIDAGFKQAAAGLVDAIDNLEKGKVKQIINSHGHGDHVGGNASFGRDVILIGHNNCKESLSREGLQVKAFEEEYIFSFNGEEIKCIPLPGGHSPCDIIVHIPGLKIACLGDIYLSESFPLVGTGSGARAQTLVKNLKTALEILPEGTKLIPGHGREATTDDLKEYIDMVETTIEIVRKEMKSGKELAEIQEADVLKDWGEWGNYFNFITKDSWIEQIFVSYRD